MDVQKIIGEIYDKVFCKTYSDSYYVFLCGGAGKDHIRNTVRGMLEKNNYQILYPEDLFVDIINNDKKSDLLDYENLLAQNADVVCVICESPGSFAELGAFVQNDTIKSRMVAAINYRYKRDKSFIMLGPIRHLRKINPHCVLEYNETNLEEFVAKLGKAFNHIRRKWTRGNEKLSFNNLSTYIAFIPVILYFFKDLDRQTLYKGLKNFLIEKGLMTSDFSDLFNASIKYLIKTRKILSEISGTEKQESFKLSTEGVEETKYILSKSRQSYRNMLHDKIRCGIMNKQFNN